MCRYFLLLTGLFSLGLSAQPPQENYFSFTYANDYFTATDYYFTQGLNFEFGNQKRAFFVGQEGYTPTSIRISEIQAGDRPYAGSLYLGYLRNYGKKEGAHWSHRFSAGVIGPLSLAAAEQRWIHAQTGNIEPMGWDNQIANDLLLNYQFTLNHSLYAGEYGAVHAGAVAMAGSYRNRLEANAEIMAGLPGRYGVTLHLRPAAHLNIYDATLQGGLFNRGSPYTLSAAEITRFVGILDLGIKVLLGKLEVGFSHTYLTREFRSGRKHAYGSVVLAWHW